MIWLKVASNQKVENETAIFDGIILDDSFWKQITEFNHLLVNITDNAPVSLIVYDFNGSILYANNQTFSMYGYTREEFLAKNLHSIDVPENIKQIIDQTNEIRERREIEFDAIQFRKDGTIIPLRIKAKIIEWEGKEVVLRIAMNFSG